MFLSPATFSSSSWDTEAFPGQMGYVIPSACSGSPPSQTCPENLQREVFRKHPNQMPEPFQMTPFNAKQQRF
ncbi:hypothetical protein LDENG_00252660 [Lucifuga dentata]|nr:hypothetical protein LDENG_00252660 [Lucifuga dentata]